MEPDHYIKSLDVVLETDPVPKKGVFLLTPLSGRASVAYQMRSGKGGELKVIIECSRHGRFEARQEVRVAPGSSAASQDTLEAHASLVAIGSWLAHGLGFDS
jgi:hypothetical protein